MTLVCHLHNANSLQFKQELNPYMDYLSTLGCKYSNLFSFGSHGRKQLHFCSFWFNTDCIFDSMWCIYC